MAVCSCENISLVDQRSTTMIFGPVWISWVWQQGHVRKFSTLGILSTNNVLLCGSDATITFISRWLPCPKILKVVLQWVVTRAAGKRHLPPLEKVFFIVSGCSLAFECKPAIRHPISSHNFSHFSSKSSKNFWNKTKDFKNTAKKQTASWLLSTCFLFTFCWLACIKAWPKERWSSRRAAVPFFVITFYQQQTSVSIKM